ncbi:DUF3788 domain-containing protein [Kineothrix sp. MB12-C1]|uniref:DUF3788 domain-containing protein n=1 Tax=Kineothrix sp. MB12-C1 TaxID=3070215 RepID=UPI0027D31D53|nr:DUF3788 domain-containing protein [Kineothrix sp. MB12-C1]WMC93910.1 DUF3788 domain-containing protein [Kineothrix sp. MB12-C1]
MNWHEFYPKDNRPDLSAISAYINNPLWDELCSHLENSYGVSPTVEYSICSGAPGWNLKYKKSGRALCTLYPAEGFFTCLVSIGSREAMEADLLLVTCTDYLQELYQNTEPFNGGRWLMIRVASPEILCDVKALIALRVKKKK